MKKEIFTFDSEKEFGIEDLKYFIEKHKKLLLRYQELDDMYIGDYPILKQEPKAPYKPDNRLVVNYAKYIVDTFGGYFLGTPIKISHEDEAVNDYIEYINKYNDQEDNNAEISKFCDIYGHGYELIYTDELGEVGLTYINPKEGFIIYDKSIRQRPLIGVRYYINEDKKIEGTYSDNNYIYYFIEKDDTYIITDVQEHYFQEVPLNEYSQNTERQGAFENVETLINALNKAISEKANDVDYFADAYLLVLGELLDEKSIEKLRDSRTINIAGDYDEMKNITVKFLEKPNADETQENLIERLEKLIFQISMVSNINEENFGTDSGIALLYKLQAMSNLAITKQRKFESGLNRRYRLISNLPNSKLEKDSWVKIRYDFTRNIPNNLQDEADMAVKLQGIVADKYIYQNLSIIDNVQEAVDELKKEQYVNMDQLKEDDIHGQL